MGKGTFHVIHYQGNLRSIWVVSQHFLQDCFYAVQRLRSICATTHSKQNLHRPSKGRKNPDVWLPLACKEMALITLWSCIGWSITETCLYNFDPHKPHFYIVKLGFTGVYIIFLISAPKNIDGSNEYHKLCFEQKCEKYQNFSSVNFPFLAVKFSVYLNRRVLVMWVIAWRTFAFVGNAVWGCTPANIRCAAFRTFIEGYLFFLAKIGKKTIVFLYAGPSYMQQKCKF